MKQKRQPPENIAEETLRGKAVGFIGIVYTSVRFKRKQRIMQLLDEPLEKFPLS